VSRSGECGRRGGAGWLVRERLHPSCGIAPQQRPHDDAKGNPSLLAWGESDALLACLGVVRSSVALDRIRTGTNGEALKATGDGREQSIGIRAIREQHRLTPAELVAVVLTADLGDGFLDASLQLVNRFALLWSAELIIRQRQMRSDSVLRVRRHLRSRLLPPE
jgi:hypothetical protein